ncbi:hypothetical protein GQ43DRAFT_464751 [Delitschia confertaspora ATCC 74209]|uniref:Fe2OG dioxygenase domain-containing protein n=1 Tax=Delitschia confertaspora ATCC 74209 TaxID=1513339 RepID=A0A9P4JHI0_9PLEO|nr:hypothetical protein GQ43DRAFT_464751 [Delitschia confertaspora ATCC 74209]
MVSLKQNELDVLAPYRIPDLPPNFYYIPNFITEEEEVSILQKIPSQRWVTLSHRRLQAHPSTLTANNTLLGAPLPAYLVKPIIESFKELGVFKITPHKEPNHVLINEYSKGEGIMPHEDGSAYAEVVATVSLGASICLELSEKKPSEENKELPVSSKEGEASGGHEPFQGVHKASETAKGDSFQSASSDYKLPTRILQEPRSLLITTGPAYKNLLHGISPTDVDENLKVSTVANWHLLSEPDRFADGRNERGTRVSLTYRDVLKVSSAANKVLGAMKKK